ncbi:MAG TPA: protein kinase [Gemmatimonadaceae bacterium]|nr:protein kinase [Gemmatimonadaceae bacterium]
MAEHTAIEAGSSIDRYEVVSLLSAGGMGEVYRARDPLLERELVLKVLPQRTQFHSEPLERFVREARAASALNHPNIVTIYAIGESDGCHFIAMELVKGKTLRQLGRDGVPAKVVAQVGSQAARALAVAHEAGIVHRDIKPENVMVRDDGYVKVLDFGIAQLSSQDEVGTGPDDSRLTKPGMVVGTMRYMSPEQATADEIAPASDMFSLGLVLYELATGRHPFEASSDMAVLSSIILREAPPPSRLNPRIPKEFDKIIERMLAKKPAARPTAIEVATVLAAIAEPAASAATDAAPQSSRGEVVGRELEKTALREEFAAAASGRAAMVCVSGEPGIGKTTLVEDFLSDLLRTSAHLVARGRCSERLAGAEAFLPILDALEDLLSEDPGGAIRTAFQTHAPSWTRQVAPFDTGAGPAAPPASQERLKREVAAFLSAICAMQPLVLFIEDIHWADRSTVDLLAYINTRLSHDRLFTIVTFRPSELQLAQHPFLALKLDLQTRGIARELPLAFLTENEVRALLALKFPGSAFPAELSRMIHSRTEGNPLFVADVAQYLRTKDVVRESGGVWSVVGSLPDLERELPESMRSMVQRKIGQLSELDSQLLVAASVQGHSFDSSVISAALERDPAQVEERLDELERVYTFVLRRDEYEYPDGTLTTRYRFVHVLYQNALYASLSVSRKVQLSKAIGEALLKANKGVPGPVAAELGFLFETAREADRASEYFAVAARNAARVFAIQEAAVLARRGLAMLAKVEESPERKNRELSLQSVLGTSLAASQGYAAPEVLVAMARARVLAEELGKQPQLAPVIWGLFAYYLVSGDIPEARSMADQYLRWAEAIGDPLILVGAHCAEGICQLYVGNIPASREHCELAATFYDRDQRPAYHTMYRMDPGVFFQSERARSLWLLGMPDTALTARDAALELGAESPDPRSLAFAMLFGGVLHQLRREADKTLEYTTKCIEICDEHGIAQERVWAMAIHGWALAFTGHPDEGVKEIEASIAIQRSRHAELNLTFALRQLAEALNKRGSYEMGREAAREGLQISERHGEVASKVELYRIMGESVRELAREADLDHAEWATRSGSTVSPEACFRAAVDLAKKQGAKSFELRAAIAMAYEMEARGHGNQAREIIRELRAQFTEGLDTKDLRDADGFLAGKPLERF